MYMSETVGVAQLRQNLSVYLRRVSRGERLVVTDRNRPVAELGPLRAHGSALDALIADRRVSAPSRRGLPPALELTGDPHALSAALEQVRGGR
jgi:prevent-host-death family protein